MAKQRPLTPERRQGLVEACMRLISDTTETPVQLAEICRWFVGFNLYEPITPTWATDSITENAAIERRAASDPIVHEIVTEAFRRGGVIG